MFKILVVEDDKDLNKTVCSFLNQNGYEAKGCLNTDDAYDALYSSVFDLIVSDIMRGEISVESVKGKGTTFTVRIRKKIRWTSCVS